MTPYTPPRWAASPPPSPRTLKIAAASLAVAVGLLVAGGTGVEPMAGALYGLMPVCTVDFGTDQTLVAQVRGVGAGDFCANNGPAAHPTDRVIPNTSVDGRTALCTLYKNGNRIRLYATSDLAGLVAGGLACPAVERILRNN